MSEMISAILLISLVVAGAAIVAVFLVSSPPPEKIPKVDIEYNNISDTAFFSNVGGDTLYYDRVYIRRIWENGSYIEYGEGKDTNVTFSNATVIKPWDNSTDWNYGSATQVGYDDKTKGYQIIYRGGQGEYLLKEFNEAAFSGSSISEEPLYEQCADLDCNFTPSNNYYTITGTQHTVTFTADNQTYNRSEGYEWGWFLVSEDFARESNEMNPTFTFTLPPDACNRMPYTFNLTHWVANNNYPPCSCNKTQKINIYKSDCPDIPCYASFDWEVECPSRKVNFTGYNEYSQEPSFWNYSLDNPSGTKIINDKDGSYIFSADGSYDVYLNVAYDDGSSCSSLHTVVIDCCKLTASFTGTQTSPGYFEFTDTSTMDPAMGTIDGWVWDFGDGSIPSTSQHPTHQFTSCGSKTVSLTVSSAGSACGSKTVTNTFTVSGIPVNASYVPNIDSNNPLLVNFHDISDSQTNITRWLWTFADGTELIWNKTERDAAGGLTPHLYSREGDYPVTLDVTNDCGETDQVVQTVHLNSICNMSADFAFDADIITQNVAFTDLSSGNGHTIDQWLWQFGDGTNSTEQNPTHHYAMVAPYTVVLTIYNETNECSDSIHKLVYTDTVCNPVDARFAPTLSEGYANLSVTFTITNPANATRWNWDFGDGTSVERTTLTNPESHQYSRPGKYTVTLVASNECGKTDVRQGTVIVNCRDVTAGFTFTPFINKATNTLRVDFTDTSYNVSPVSPPDASNISYWRWDFGDGNYTIWNWTQWYEASHKISWTYPEIAPYTAKLTVRNGCGSQNETTKLIYNATPCDIVANFTPLSVNGTAPLSIPFSDNSTTSSGTVTGWNWDFGDGYYSNEQNPVHLFNRSGRYTVTLTSSSECGSSTKTGVVNLSCPAITAGYSYRYLAFDREEKNLTVLFTDTSEDYGYSNITKWTWTFGDGSNKTVWDRTARQLAGGQIAHKYPDIGSYTAVLEIENECGSKDWTSHLITDVNCTNVTADFGYQYLSANWTTNNMTVQFTDVSQGHGSNLTQWTWDFGDGNTTIWNLSQWQANLGQITHKFPSLAAYLVTLTIQNECGSQDTVQKLVSGTPCPDIIANFTPLQINGSAPLEVPFIDYTTGNVTRWHWDFGDGTYEELIRSGSVNSGDVNHTYNLSGHYVVTLIATGECGNAGVKSGYVDVECPNVSVDFGYTYLDEETKTVQFTAYVDPPLNDEDIIEWNWLFGDGSTGTGQNVTHTYGLGREDTIFNVIITAKNYCGKQGQNLKILYPYCPNLTPLFTVTPHTGEAPLEVSFTENSTNLSDIISWRWFFGDGEYYYTADPASRIPPNHTYENWGTYYITEQLQNKCGNLFTMVRTVNVTSPAYVYGHIWDDLNVNGVQNAGEWDLANWNVALEERVNGIWTTRATTRTNASGWYEFPMNNLTYGIFRVTENLPAIWNVTTSYGVTRDGPDKNPSTGTILIFNDRNFRVDFGNVDWHVSSMQLPPGYNRPRPLGFFTIADTWPRYWGFSTSYHPEEIQIKYNEWIYRNGDKVFQVPPYGCWGNSSFSLTPTPYSAYIITVNSNTQTTVTISHSLWIERWVYNGVTYIGKTFSVPDNTTYNGDLLSVYMSENNDPQTVIDPPYENQVIPYDRHYGVFKDGQFPFACHVTGTGTNINTTLKTPEVQVLRWNSSWAYFTMDWDNRLYEGQNVLFTTESSFKAPTNAVIRGYRNVSVDFQPLVPSIINLTQNSPTPGYITINAHVKGHNYDPANVSVVLGNASVGELVVPMTWTNGNMIWDGGWNNSTAVFDSESMAGKVVPVVIRATPRYDGGRLRGKTVDSPVQYVTIRSRYPIQANFTADPTSGPSPLEVAFTDLSTGGPGSWDWNFGDGSANVTGSTIDKKNPIHIFNQTGIFPVTLTVRDIDNNPSSYQQNVTVTNYWHTANLYTSRTGSLVSGGSVSWLMSGSGSVTVGGVTHDLLDGDNVRLTLLSSQYEARILVAGGISAFNCTNVQLAVNGANVQQGVCTGIHVPEYENFHSSLKITTTRDSAAWVNFVWDGAPVSVPTTRNLEVSDLMPKDRFMDINVQPSQIYFDGNASSYRLFR